MDTLLKICSYLILAWLIFGMLYPQKALGFMKNDNSKKRKNVVLFAVLALIGCGMFFGLLEAVFAPKNEKQIAQSASSIVADTTTKAKKNEVDSVTNALLEKQRKEDSITVKKLKSLFYEKRDEFDQDGGYWVEPKDRPKYLNQNGVYCYFYMNKNGKPSNMRFRFQYYADDWLFIRTLKIKIDDGLLVYTPQKMDRDNSGGKIWEWFDEGKSQNPISSAAIFRIANAKTVKIRLEGQQYQKDITLTTKQINSFKNTIDYYRALGGEL